jgi:16S rRNA (cytosine967-C5)-methyltransferase
VPTPAGAAQPIDPRDEACRILLRLESPEARARELIDEAAQRMDPAGPDPAFLAELVYGTLRHRGRIDDLLGRVSHRPLEALSPWVRNLLRLSLHQILYLDRVPAGAAVDQACNIARRQGHDGVVKFVNGCLRELCRQQAEDKLPPLPLHPVQRLAVESSHPLWMAERFCEQFGWERAAAGLEASNHAAPLTLRVNPLRARRDELAGRLHQAGHAVEPCRWSPWGLRVKGPVDARRLPGFQEGDFHVQDESAQLLGLLMDPQPGWQVADVCAAPGTKTAQLAELVGPGGRVWAFDRKGGSAEKMQAMLRRQGYGQVHCEARDGLYPREDLQGRLDAVLVDAPCSALGLLRRRPESRWQQRPDASTGHAQRQLRLLRASAAYLRPGGVLLYSVCTWDARECESVVWRLLEEEPGLVFERAGQFIPSELATRDGFLRVWPGQDQMDGFFAARLRRTEAA